MLLIISGGSEYTKSVCGKAVGCKRIWCAWYEWKHGDKIGKVSWDEITEDLHCNLSMYIQIQVHVYKYKHIISCENIFGYLHVACMVEGSHNFLLNFIDNVKIDFWKFFLMDANKLLVIYSLYLKCFLHHKRNTYSEKV